MSLAPNQRGFSILEVIIALAMTVIVVVVIGKSLSAILRLANASQLKTEAFIYAQESLELATAFKNDFFSCSGSTGVPCVTTDSQSCTPNSPYTSCWVAYPIGFEDETEFFVNGSYELELLDNGNPEPVPANPFFSRKITIQTLRRNATTFDIDPAGTLDPGTKQITVTVFWNERGHTKSESMSSIVTAWQNLCKIISKNSTALA